MKNGCIVTIVIVLMIALNAWLYVKFLRTTDTPVPSAAVATSTAAFQSGTGVQAGVPAIPQPPPPELTMADFQLTPANAPLSANLTKEIKNCRTGIVVDLTNRTILWEKRADEPVAIASMTKMMTTYLLMRAIHVDKRVALTDVVPVSRTAEKIGGSQVWLAEGESFSVEDLAKCMMIKSANDATELIAEHLAGGDSAQFVVDMNEKARQLGLAKCKFYNAHGLPPDKKRRAPENSGTAREMAFLASLLLEYPDAVRWASTKEDRLIHQKGVNKVTQLINHNKLIVNGKLGVNGMKTGYTEKSRYCTAVTCTRDGRSLIVVVTGSEGLYGRQRDILVSHILDWAYSQKPAAAPAPAPIRPAASTPARTR